MNNCKQKCYFVNLKCKLDKSCNKRNAQVLNIFLIHLFSYIMILFLPNIMDTKIQLVQDNMLKFKSVKVTIIMKQTDDMI